MAIARKMRIKLRSFDHKLLDQSAQKIVAAATESGARVAGPVPLPTEKRVYCIVRPTALGRSERSMEHYELRTHKRLVDIIEPTQQTIESLMRLELPGSVEIEIKQ
jgi:small subunit ribosomal protein S10